MPATRAASRGGRRGAKAAAAAAALPLPADDGVHPSELKRCPFCCGVAAFGKVNYDEKTVRKQKWTQAVFYFVHCVLCGADTKGLVGSRTKREAADKWNRRFSPESC